MSIPFTTLMQRVEEKPGRASLDVPADWMQGRSVFGGLQVALAIRAMRTLVPQAQLRTLQATFSAPSANTIHCEARILRSGKSATHVEARLVDGSVTSAIAIGVFGD